MEITVNGNVYRLIGDDYANGRISFEQLCALVYSPKARSTITYQIPGRPEFIGDITQGQFIDIIPGTIFAVKVSR